MTRQADELHELITSSYDALEEDRKDAESRRDAAKKADDRNFLRNWMNLFRQSGVKFPFGIGFVLLMLVVVAFVLLGGDDADAPANEDVAEAPANEDVAEAPANEDVAAEVGDSEDGGPLDGTWVMYWRNAEGTDGVAFTLRFVNPDGSGLDVLNDDDEFDTWIELDGDVLRFGFTRTFQKPAAWPADGSPFPAGGWPEKSWFVGTRTDDGTYVGTWTRDDWECSPVENPPCVIGSEPAAYDAWIEPQP